MSNTIKSHLKETLVLAFPVAVGQLGHIMFGVTDSLMVGRVGKIPLAAASLVNGLFILILILGIGLSLAITPLVAIAKGAEKHDECGIILRQSLIVNVTVSVILMTALYFISEIIHLLNQPPEVVQYAKSYLQILTISVLPFMIFQTYRQFIEGLSFTKPAMYINLAANVVNVFGNWIFIYGNLGSPAYGLDGAGYSTLITRLFMAAAMMQFVILSPRFREYDPSLKFKSINWRVIKKIINVGLPTSFASFFEAGAFSVSAIIIGWIGSVELAAHQIAISIASISFMIILGISAAGTIRVGNLLGKKSYREMRSAGFSAILFAALLMSFFGLCFILLRNFLPTLFVTDKDVISIASSLIIIAAIFQISDGVQAVGLGSLRGITDVKIPMFITFVAYWIIGLPIGYYLGFHLNYGVQGIWIGLLTGLFIAAVFFTIRFNFKSKQYIKKAEI